MQTHYLRPSAVTLSLLTCLGLSASIAGCGGEPGLAKVTGRITYKSEPVTSGTVYFSPEEPGQRGAQGPLDSSGYFSLGTFQPGDGAYTGKHLVSVVAQGPDKPIPAKMKGKMMEEDMQGTGDPLIPRKYFSADKSGLTADVSDDSNNFEFELTD